MKRAKKEITGAPAVAGRADAAMRYGPARTSIRAGGPAGLAGNLAVQTIPGNGRANLPEAAPCIYRKAWFASPAATSLQPARPLPLLFMFTSCLRTKNSYEFSLDRVW